MKTFLMIEFKTILRIYDIISIYVNTYTIEFSKIHVHIRYIRNSCLDYSPTIYSKLITVFSIVCIVFIYMHI